MTGGVSAIVVTPNPAIDVTYDVADARLGVTNRVQHVYRRPGGKGINVARVLETLGHRTMSVLPLGGATGDWLQNSLRTIGLATEASMARHDSRTTVTVTEPGRHPTVFAEPGASMSADEWMLLTSAVAHALARGRTGPKMLVVSGSFPPESDLAVIGEWIGLAAALSIPTLVDSSGDALLAAAHAGADIVKPNADELLAATGAGTLEAGMNDLLNRGAGLVVVSQGPDGIIATDGGKTWRAATPERLSGNPTGAGDAASAGLVAALLSGLPIETGLTWAAAAGAASVLRPTAGEIDLADFRAFLDRLSAGGPPHECQEEPR